jgi:2-iminobutanoate/2-iminopropanoate deaminase
MPEILDVPGVTTSASPYPSAVTAGNLVFVSGQVSFDDAGAVVGKDVTAQTRQALTRLERILAATGATLHDLVSATVYLTDGDDAAKFNQEWMRWFTDHRPARATVIAGLLDSRLLVEIQAIAVTHGAGRKEAE